MELKITHIAKLDLKQYAGSCAELGDGAGIDTWDNALEDNALIPLTTEEDLEYARDYFRTFGAWSREELAAMSDDAIRALTLQFVAGDLRQYLQAKKLQPMQFKRWEECQGGSVYKSGREYYYYLGS